MKKLFNCYIKHCNKELKKILEKKKIIEEFNNLVSLFIEKKITKTKFIKLITNLYTIHYNSPYFTKYANCLLNNCYDILEKTLDFLLSIVPTIKFKKSLKYTVDDYIYILIKTIKVRIIMPVINRIE